MSSCVILFHRQQYKIVQFFADFFPVGHVFVHQSREIFVMVPNFQMQKFVKDDIVQTPFRGMR